MPWSPPARLFSSRMDWREPSGRAALGIRLAQHKPGPQIETHYPMSASRFCNVVDYSESIKLPACQVQFPGAIRE
jgi:hypothetical protein